MSHTQTTEVGPYANEVRSIRVSVQEMLSDTFRSVNLTSRLSKGNLNMHQGMSFDDMGILETLMVRGAREIRLREFHALFHEVKAYMDDFRAKADKADPLLMAFGEPLPVARTPLDEVRTDEVLSTRNHAWTDNMGRAYHALMDCVEDTGRMLAEYWDALDRISEKVNNR